jgi:hypothetical protein
MTMDNVGLKISLLGTSSYMITFTCFFLDKKPKWYEDKFNNQSRILREQEVTS